MQSCAIFSGTQMCGTIVKPMRTKCDGSCVNAQSVENPPAVAVAATVRHELGADVAAAECLVDDERAHFGDLAAERRELRAADDRLVDLGDDEPRDVPLDVLEASEAADGRLSRLSVMSRWMAGASDGLAVRNVTEAFTVLFPPLPLRTPDRAGRTPRPLPPA